MWKQDPSVAEIGTRKAYLPGMYSLARAMPGSSAGPASGGRNALGDFIVSPANADAFDAVHTFAVVRQTLTMYQRNRGGSAAAVAVERAGQHRPDSTCSRTPGVTMNAFYSRTPRR